MNNIISIIITTRNRKESLFKCLKSVKSSSLKTSLAEIIVVDDNSNDGSEKLTKKDLKIKKGNIFHLSQQVMMVKARNLGIKKSTGKYLIFVDDDNLIDKIMIQELVDFAKNNNQVGIVGPSMYNQKGKKYFDYQKINFFTGATTMKKDLSSKTFCLSDGIPNVFLIKREVFEKCGLFDEELIQSLTEPDFSFLAGKKGYQTLVIKKAKTYHDIKINEYLDPLSLGGKFNQKAYCLIRNRMVIIARYASWWQKLIFFIFFSSFWPVVYSLLSIKGKRTELIKYYFSGFKDGLYYLLTGKLINSLPKLLSG